MEDMYQEFRDIADFLVIYINEAHPGDGLSADKDPARQIPNHRTFEARCTAATRMLDESLMSIPCLADDMNNSTDITWRAWPDKVFVVNSAGIVALAGEDGPYGFEPAMQETRQWLEHLRETGEEPEVIPGKAGDFASVLIGELHPDGPQDEYLEKIDRARAAVRQNAQAKLAAPPTTANKTNIASRQQSAMAEAAEESVAESRSWPGPALANTICFVLAGLLLVTGWIALVKYRQF